MNLNEIKMNVHLTCKCQNIFYQTLLIEVFALKVGCCMLLHPVGTRLNDLIGICSILQYWGMAKINKNDDKSKWGMSPIRKSHVYNKHHKITQTIKMLQRESCVLERCQDCHRIRNYIYSDPKRKKIPLDRKWLQKHAIRSTKIYNFFFKSVFHLKTSIFLYNPFER